MLNAERLARNIRYYRMQLGLSQMQLAGMIHVTSQNISKWELGKSIPDLEHLCKLSDVLSVSVDCLLYTIPEREQNTMLIAIDGGGTKTEFILFNENGEVFQTFCLGGTNPNAVGLSASQSILCSGIDRIAPYEHGVKAITAGIAGCGVSENRKQMTTFFKKKYPDISFDIGTDVRNVIYSAENHERCIAVICGTGSVVYAKTPKEQFRVGGWGYLFQSGMSGYDLGRDALQAVLEADDGVSAKTGLKAYVEEKLEGSVWDRIDMVYRMSRDEIAAFATVVFSAYRENDAVAKRILTNNADRLASLIKTAASQYDCGKNVLLSGGITAEHAVILPLLQERLPDDLTLTIASYPQICGAAACCCELFAKLSPSFLPNLYANYLKFKEEQQYA